MKFIALKILLSFVIVCDIAVLKSQNLNIAHHTYVDEVSCLVSINSKYFYSEIVYSQGFGESTNIIGLNEDGKILFKYNLAFDESNRPRKIIKTFDNCLLIAGGSSGCDYDLGPENFIVKIDTNGVLKFQVTTYPEGGEWPTYISDFIEHTDSSFYFAGGSQVYHFSKNGQFISTFSVDLVVSGAIAPNSNGNFFVNGFDSTWISKTIEINSSGVVINQKYSEYYDFIINHPSSDDFYALGNGSIEKINSSFTPVANSSAFINPGIRISSLVLKHDSIFFTGTASPDDMPVYGILNKDLIPLQVSPSPYKHIYPTGIAVDNKNRINILANARSMIKSIYLMGDNEKSFTSFYRFPFSGNFLSKPDIGVVNISLASAVSNSILGNSLINLKVKIRNYGSDTIKSFCLSSLSRQDICGFDLFHKSYSKIILPHDSIVIETENFYSSLVGYSSKTPDYIFDSEICLFTSVPNEQSDAQINNDNSCSRVSTSDTIVKKTILREIKGFYIYPNPFAGDFKIESESEIKEITIFNLLGCLIRQFPVNAKICTVSDFNESKGIYILKIETGEKMQIKKMIKD